jgi:hypothetical protein
MTEQKEWKPTKEWLEWYLAPAIDYRKVYGDPFVWTEQEKQLMLLQKLKEQDMTGYESKRAAAQDKLKQPVQEPPPWWPAVENILTEYGLQAIDFVADFKNAMKDAAQPVQEPVGYVYSEAGVKHGAIQRDLPNGTPLYTNPPQRPWVDLTENDLVQIGVATGLERAAVEMISNKHKEKNNG